jgi:succinoglycan biosynthesis transport protein ExoP
MRTQSLLDVIWRRRWMVIGSVVLAAIAAGLVSKTLDKRYSTSSKLLIVPSGDAASFDATQAAQVTARTYSDVLSSPNFARLVATRLGGGAQPSAVADAVEIEPIPETQLLEIKSEGSSPRAAKRLADTYASVFLAYQERSLSPTTKASVSLADAAPLVDAPSRPRPMLNILLACLLSLPLSIGIAVLRERLDTRLNSVEELSERFDLPLLARVPLRGRADASSPVFLEAFRMLRTMVRFVAGGTPPRCIAISSASEGEGKTTTTFELAMAALETGQKVLVVEADPYRPQLMRLLDERGGTDLTRSRPGLSDYLAGDATITRVVYPTAFAKLKAVPAGPLPPSMSGLLEGTRGRSLIEKLGNQADLVLLDCPPIGLSADAAVLASRAEAVVFVIDLKISNAGVLRNSLERLRSANARVLGAVVNRDSGLRLGDYGYYGQNARSPRDEPEPRPAEEEKVSSPQQEKVSSPQQEKVSSPQQEKVSSPQQEKVSSPQRVGDSVRPAP